MTELHAYCGLDCAACPVHIATLTGDEAQKRELAGQMTSERYPLTASDIHCHGCSSDRQISFCDGCDIRSCAVATEQESCAFCSSYPCAKLDKHLQGSPESRRNLEDRRRGLSNRQVLAEALDLLAATANLVLSTVDADGWPQSRAMMKTRIDGLRTVEFTTSNQSDKVAQLRLNNRASLYIADHDRLRGLSLYGSVQILEDRATKQANLLPGFERYYPDGADTPWLCVLRFSTTGGQYYHNRPYALSASMLAPTR